jgi:glutathione S-transferase
MVLPKVEIKFQVLEQVRKINPLGTIKLIDPLSALIIWTSGAIVISLAALYLHARHLGAASRSCGRERVSQARWPRSPIRSGGGRVSLLAGRDAQRVCIVGGIDRSTD